MERLPSTVTAKMHTRPPHPSARHSDKLLTRNVPGESFDIQPMLHPADNVPPYEITSFIDVEEACVERAREAIRVKCPVIESYPALQLARSCPFRPVVARQLARGRHPHASSCGSRIHGAGNVDRLKSVLRQDVTVKLSVGRSVDAGDFTLGRNS